MNRSPPRFPRALFVACLALAGAALSPVKQQTIRATPAQISARDRSVREIIKRFGRAFMAASRAADAFESTGRMGRTPPPVPRIDPIVACITNAPGVHRAIGKPDGDDAWIEVDRTGARPLVRIFWRGALIAGERPVRALEGEPGRERVVKARRAAPAQRSLSLDHMREAMQAAREAMRAAGFAVSAFHEVRRLEREDFRGAVATIGLA